MNLREHVLLGGVAAVPVAATLGVDAGAAFWASSVLLDIDHYWEYLVRNGFRNWSWRKTFAFHHEVFKRIQRPELLAISLFHTIEWLVLVYVASRWWGGTVAMAALGGMVFHLALDLLRLAWWGKITTRVLSVVEYVIRRRRLIRRGMDPDVVYREALTAIGVAPSRGAHGFAGRDERGGVWGAMSGPASFTVVVPALNEEENLRPTVESILKEIGPVASELEVLVFDDASTDRTGAVADALELQDSRVRAIHNRERLNIGGSYKAGLARARGEYYVLVPGDNETRADEIARGFASAGPADLIMFYITNPGVRGTSRRLLSGLYVITVNALFGTRFRYTNGTNVFRTDVLRKVPIRTNGFSYQTEAVVKAVRSGVNYVEVAVELGAREAGTSKALTWKNLKGVAAALTRLWWDVRITHRSAYRMCGRKVGAF